MVKRIENAKAIISVGLIAISATAAIVLDHILSGPLKGWSVYLAIGLVSLAAWSFQYSAEALINHSRHVRKLLSGEDYIEGTWIEIYQPSNSDTCHYGVIEVQYCDGEICLSAETYKGPDLCSERGGWNSKVSHYENGSLVYFYEERVEERDVTGAGRLDFSRRGDHPTRYQSRIFDPIHVHNTLGLGYKVENKSDLDTIRIGGTALRNLLRKYGHEVSQLGHLMNKSVRNVSEQ